jgi:2-polyprenyl-6-methoxyphenol hydroxylase-like FAD-dependent oxidoreductase
MRMRRLETEVLVVGAGPVGLMSALMLTERGIRVRIVDQERWTGEHNFALTLHGATLRILDDVGLADGLLAAGIKVKRVALRDATGRRAELRLDELESEMPYALVLSQSALEDVLERRLREKGVRVEWSHHLSELRADEDGVSFELEQLGTGSGGYPISHHLMSIEGVKHGRASHVIGADGFHSMVRRRAGIDVEPAGAPTWYAAVELDGYRGPFDESEVVLDADTADVLWPLPGGRCRWSLQVDGDFPAIGTFMPGERVADTALDRDEVLAILGRRAPWFDASGLEVVRSLRVHFEPAVARSFGDGRIHLAGDACHVASPIGVQSMNAGLLDAHDLAANLARVLRNGGDGERLERHDRARAAAWRQLLDAPAVGEGADPWVAAHAGRILSCIPAIGGDLRALGRQLGLELAGPR